MENKYNAEVQDIANKLTSIIIREVSKNTPTDSYKNYVEHMFDNIEQMIEQGKAVLKDAKEDNLTFNTIESEGYLRGLIYVYNELKINLQYYIKDDE